ncbi:hypothetical protein [Halobacillus ihumii]|uniref:hypothetical protein n=1 Tax=Halobacillus ihumii TaxID=2686092 RepID=UPI0013D54286|nr:hypothetical protein [Halobacillus ihumii]
MSGILTILGIIVLLASPSLVGMFRKRSSRSRSKYSNDFGDRLRNAKTGSRAQSEARIKISAEANRNSGGGPGF